MFMPKSYRLTIPQLLPDITGCHNFKTMSVRSTTALSSVFGRQNMQYVGRFFRNQADFFFSISPSTYLTVFYVVNLALQNRLAQVAG